MNQKFSRKKFRFFRIILAVAILAFPVWGWRYWSEKNVDLLAVEKVVQLNDGRVFFQTMTWAETVEDFLAEQAIAYEPSFLVYPDLEDRIFSGSKITILRPQKVFIQVDGQKLEKEVFSPRVAGAVVEAGVELSPLDKIQPEPSSAVEVGTEIIVTRIEIEEKEETEKIPFETIEENDSDLAWKKKKVKQAGQEGLRKVRYKITYKNGKVLTKEKISQTVEKKPVAEIVSVGTKIKVGQSKVGVASWYAHTGTMACASRMFPRGTWLRVTSRENGKQIFVVVNDYGPMRGTGKMIDLDKVAFEKLAPLGKGVVEVKVEEILD